MSVPGGKADLAAAAEDVWNCPIFRVAMLLTDDGWAYYVGEALLAFRTRGHLSLIEVKISGPRGAGQYLRRALSTCFLDFNHYRSRVDFRLRLSARCSNVIESRPKTINPDCSLQSKRLSRLPVSAAHASYSHHVDRNRGTLC
jgi:hypothetical protein